MYILHLALKTISERHICKRCKQVNDDARTDTSAAAAAAGGDDEDDDVDVSVMRSD